MAKNVTTRTATAVKATAKVAAPKGPKKQLDLSTASVADGSLKPVRSVYELMGIKNVSYREKSYGAYQDQLRRMNVIELQDHAYEVGVVPGATKDSMIDRLERKFLQENPDQRDAYYAAKAAGASNAPELSLEEQAQRILARGR